MIHKLFHRFLRPSSSQQEGAKPKRTFLGLLGLGTIVSMTLFSACLPASYSMQIQDVINCGSTPLSQGTFDIQVTDTYQMSIRLSNWLTVTSNPAQYTPETNYIELRRVRVWFEYPAGFTIPPTEALYGESQPREELVNGRMDPSLIAGLQTTGGAGGGVSSLTTIRFRLIPPETARLWSTAQELKQQQTNSKTIVLGSHFVVIAHVTVFGQAGAGAEVSTPELKFPIAICKGCLDAQAGQVSCSSGGNCTGQDGACLQKEEKGENP